MCDHHDPTGRFNYFRHIRYIDKKNDSSKDMITCTECLASWIPKSEPKDDNDEINDGLDELYGRKDRLPACQGECECHSPLRRSVSGVQVCRCCYESKKMVGMLPAEQKMHWGYNKQEIDERMESLITTVEAIANPYNIAKSNTEFMRKKFL